jgi:hypothetical protein
MAQITPNLSLTVWNNLSDPYNSDQLAINFINIDRHDHSPGNGAQIDGATAIKSGSIGNAALAGLAVSTANIQPQAVTTDKIATGNSSGIQTANIADGAVTVAKLSSASAIGKSKINTIINDSESIRPYYINATATSGTGSFTQTLTNLGLTNANLNPGGNTYTGDGIEIFVKPYTTSTTSVPVWHFRYCSALDSNYPWHFVGGGSLANQYMGTTSAVSFTTTSTASFFPSTGTTGSLANLSNLILGYYEITAWADIFHSTNNAGVAGTTQIGTSTTGPSIVDNRYFSTFGGAGSDNAQSAGKTNVMAVTSATTGENSLTSRFQIRSGGGTASVVSHGIYAKPVRLAGV